MKDQPVPEITRIGHSWQLLSETKPSDNSWYERIDVIQVNQGGCLLKIEDISQGNTNWTVVFVPGVEVRWEDSTRKTGGYLVKLQEEKQNEH